MTAPSAAPASFRQPTSMISPAVRTTNDENIPPPETALTAADKTANRRVLGNVSPNVKVNAPIADLLKQHPMAGSPLKRRYTAMMEDDAGFTYLKKRRLSTNPPLSQSQSEYSQSSTRSVFRCQQGTDTEAAPLKSLDLSPPAEATAQPIPTIQEPSPTEQNTPSDSGDGTQSSSAERLSFSSLINYDPSSQTSTSVPKSTSRAEMLKLRLRVAMYKVRTNQVDVPFDRLQVNDHRQDGSVQATPQAIEKTVAELRGEAQEELARRAIIKQPRPKLLPAPVLLPTAYSSRMIYGPAMLLPNSSPASGSPERHRRPRPVVATPHRAGRQLSSPPDSAGREGSRGYELELTSSVVTGRVAEGLLGLRNAV